MDVMNHSLSAANTNSGATLPTLPPTQQPPPHPCLHPHDIIAVSFNLLVQDVRRNSTRVRLPPPDPLNPPLTLISASLTTANPPPQTRSCAPRVIRASVSASNEPTSSSDSPPGSSGATSRQPDASKHSSRDASRLLQREGETWAEPRAKPSGKAERRYAFSFARPSLPECS